MIKPANAFRDARDFQIVFLALFLFLGVWFRDWSIRPVRSWLLWDPA